MGKKMNRNNNRHKKVFFLLIVAAVFFLHLEMIWAQGFAMDSVLVIREGGKNFKEAVDGLISELEDEMSVNEIILYTKTSSLNIAEKINAVSPKIIVLMDNRAIALFSRYQNNLPESAEKIPSLAMMGVFMDLALKGLKNASGIYYKVPVVTSVVSLREILDMPFDKVGIVHRAFSQSYVDRDKEYCAKEGIILQPYLISGKLRYESKLKKGLEHLMNKDNIDAILVPNDSALINSRLLQSVWLPFARDFKRPIIVGVEVLVNPQLNFGTFAVIPDHTELGTQAAEIILEARDNKWTFDHKIVPPRSVYKIINFEQSKRLFNVDEERLQDVDNILR